MHKSHFLQTKRRIAQTLIAALSLILLLPAKASAQTDEAWVEFNSTSNTLTFKYGAKPAAFASDVTAYSLNAGDSTPAWSGKAGSVISVTYDPAFAKARPTSCYQWFSNMKKLTSIEGLEYLNTSEVTNMDDMFKECNSLTSLNLSHFNTAKVTIMSDMFAGCNSLTSLDLSAFNTGNVTHMSSMFNACGQLTSLNLSSFNTDKVERMSSMFCDCKSLISLDLSSFNTQNVVVMDFMFSGCEKIVSLDIANFNTQNVYDIMDMFSGCESLTSIDVSNFNTQYVKAMSSMFASCKSLTSLDLSNFSTGKVETMENMFNGCEKLSAIYASDNFVTTNVTNSENMFSDCTALKGAEAYDETKTDDTMANTSGYFSTKTDDVAWVQYDSGTGTLLFRYGPKPTSFASGIEGYNLKDHYWNMSSTTTVIFEPAFSKARPTDCSDWFNGLKNLTSIVGLQYLNTSEVEDMESMFYQCESLTSLDLSTFNTENVTSMKNMLSECKSLKTVNLSGFNTAKVEDLSIMFELSDSLTSLDLSSFNTENVTNMKGMFNHCSKLTTIYVSDSFVTTKVTNSRSMFSRCKALEGAVKYNGTATATMANYKTGYFKTYYSIGGEKHELYGNTLSVADLQLKDGKDFVAHAPFTAPKASWSRAMTNKWGTLCLPFAFSADDNETCAFYDLKQVETDRLVLTKLTGTVEAGHPVLVYCTDATTASLTASNVSVVKTPTDGTTADEVQLVGTFAEANVPDDSYIISKDKFWLVENLTAAAKGGAKGVKVSGQRAWLKPTTNAVAASLSLYAEDLTGINALEVLTDEASEIYDLNGRRLPALQKGVNIVKVGNVAKKVIVK